MKILIVEDEERLAKLIKKALEKEGFAADYVTDGEAAETRIEICHKDYDLVILDLMLPKKDGLEVRISDIDKFVSGLEMKTTLNEVTA